MSEHVLLHAPDRATALVEQTRAKLPWLDKVFGSGRPRVFPGVVMTNPVWLADRLQDTQARWDCPQASVNATLWWYAAAYRLVGTAVTTALVTGSAVVWTPADPVWLRSNGYLGGFDAARVTDPERCGTALAQTLAPVIDELARLGRLPADILWGLCADGVASRALTATEAGVPVTRCSRFAVEVTEQMGSLAPVPVARFLDESPTGHSRDADPTARPAEGTRRRVRRIECCKLYRTRDHDHCAHCPRRHAA